MKSFRDIRVLPVVLVAIFGLAVLKIAGLVIDGGYVFDYQVSQPAKRSWAQDNFGYPTAANADPADITGSEVMEESISGSRTSSEFAMLARSTLVLMSSIR